MMVGNTYLFLPYNCT